MNLRNLFLQTVNCTSRTVYVNASTGSDANPGTLSQPYASINWAAHQAQPGDLVLVAAGTYTYTEINGFQGNAQNWLGILPVDETSQVIVHVVAPTDNFFNVIGSSFVGIYGLEIYGDQNDSNTNGSGISIYGNSHHILVWNCHIHDFPGGGINCFDVSGSHDLLDLSFNKIHGTSKYSPSNTSGISIYASRDLTQTTWDGHYAYRIVGNYIYDVICTVPYTPGGLNFVTDGNGISIDSVQSTYGYTKSILIEGNIIVGCGGRAVHVFQSYNVDIISNTGIGNLRTNSVAINNKTEFDSESGNNVLIYANIIYPINSANWNDLLSTYQYNVVLGGSQSVTGNNINYQSTGFTYFQSNFAASDLLNLQSLSSFIPVTSDKAAKNANALGRQTLGIGPRPLSNLSVGALEPTISTRYLMA